MGAAPAYAPPPPVATSQRRGFPWAIVAVVLVLGLLAVGGGVGVLLWLRGGFGKSGAEASPTVAEQSTSAVPASLPEAAQPTSPSDEPIAESSPAAVETIAPAPQATIPVAASLPSKPPAPAPTTRESTPPTRPTSPPANVEPPRRPTPERTVPAPPPPPPADEPEEDAEPAASGQHYDREMPSTLALKFKVQPEDAYFSFKEEGDSRFTLAGQVSEHNADKKKLPAFTLPGPGTYYLRLFAEGRAYIFKLDAQPGANVTTISYVLIPKAGRRN